MAAKHQEFIVSVQDKRLREPFKETIITGGKSSDTPTAYPELDAKAGIATVYIDNFLTELVPHVIIAQRHLLDDHPSPPYREQPSIKGDPRYRQLIRYMVLSETVRNETMYYAYKRNQGGEARLKDLVSIGFGGHIDLKDVVYNEESCIDLAETINTSAKREFYEELTCPGLGGTDPGGEKNFITFAIDRSFEIAQGKKECNIIYSDATEVDRLHMGIVCEINLLGLSVLTHQGQLVKLTCAESALEMLGLFSAKDLLAQHAAGAIELESWSLIYLSNLASV